MATLMLAVFTVSVGYGVVLPPLPHLIERLLGAGAGVAQVSRHTGLLTGVADRDDSGHGRPNRHFNFEAGHDCCLS